MIRIGLVGEDPNDTEAIKTLLGKKYGKKVTFFPMVRNLTGYQLDNPKIKRALPIEFASKKCSFVIYIRDLDGHPTDSAKILSKKKWFESLDSNLNKLGILLLNIWEIEALILADIEVFNVLYGTKHKSKKDVMFIKEPKEELKRISKLGRKKYEESHCPQIMGQIRFSEVEQNCKFFREFIAAFDAKINWH